MLHHLTYVSSASALFSIDDLAELLERSRRANHERGITGMLLYKGGNFMQTIEGPADAIVDLQDSLEADPRHTGILVLLSGNRDDRLFDGWSMGFQNLADAGEAPGYSEFLNVPLTAESFGADPAGSQRLLLMFRRTMR